ncbi:MAG: hypothetical protein QM728_01025 [Gordonia sp. (in: high G+C Gram-positive bacteria)]|uniref:hypothetical protein n=1 Tax=Gordonia sp. (in: high G+C Gram-positive bacteria) TaxID=84139 RepID=UPI0039E26D92
MHTNRIAAALAAVTVAGGLAVVVAPTADAAGIATVSSRNGKLVGTARNMRTGLNECVLRRDVKPEIDGPLSGSTDHGTINLAQGRVKGSMIALSSKRLPRGWYNVTMSCLHDPSGYPTPEASRTARVYNK